MVTDDWATIRMISSATLYRRRDLLAVIALIALWLLFFWRLFTPVRADQASLRSGDFSGQFMTFAGYQYSRFAEGEVPLWNPYNNGGLPFIADTQAAVFYPPRLLTITLARLAGGWTYQALELEMTFHVLAFTLLMYLFVRRVTGSVLGGFVAAIVAGYGGFLSGYPPLQIALLEAGIYLPLAALGIYEATRDDRLGLKCLIVTGAALGLSWMAGHPQTSFFLTYLLVAYFGWRIYERRWRFTLWIVGCAVFGLIAFGLAAVQLLPGFEYLLYTTRAEFGYDAKSNGFPIQDVIQFIYPTILSMFSPLYVGVTGLFFALIALWRRVSGAWFWGVVALIGLLWSFGGNSAVFPALYNVLPGLRFFRGQERAAYLVVNSLAILAGLGATRLAQWDTTTDYPAALRLRVWLNTAVRAALLFTALVFVLWIGQPDAFGRVISVVTLVTLVVGALALLVPSITGYARPAWVWGIAALLVLELFTINMDAEPVYDPVPADMQISISPPPHVAQVLADTDGVFRVDGFRGLGDNYGSLYGVQDIHGISPLWLGSAYSLIEGALPDARTWELFAVRYVYSDWAELPVSAQLVGTGTDRYGDINIHRLDNPRPFALLMYSAAIMGDDAQAYSILADAGFDPRQTLLLQNDAPVELNGGESLPAIVTRFEPELIEMSASSPQPALLSIALPQYPGWQATVNGSTTPIQRAYGGLTAVAVPAGDSTVQLVFDPLSYRIGALLSLVTWISLLVLAVAAFVRPRRT
ncbi:MAG: YfhO family protein [Chloroflexi bacterium]|uniref:YfhO family protein n=1 Tax=Candidatus Flexifilum breve TaxID=3140694 RepID=UPI003134746E|nr:YfhO family protein [Chloroflexota bacterium]